MTACYYIRKAKEEDIGPIMDIFSQAKARMRADGNPDQWSDSYPALSDIRSDISKGSCHVLCEGSFIAATFSILQGVEPSYANIYDGHWNYDMRYAVIHRMASSDRAHNVAKVILDWCGRKWRYIRVDTHRDNARMIRVLSSNGFSCCGRVFLDSGDERLAFDKLYDD